MKKINKKAGRILIVFCLLIFAILTLCACNGKSNPHLNFANIDVTLNEDGSIDVTETHNVDFSARFDNPWWNYYKSVSTNSGKSYLTDVKIKLDGRELEVIRNGKDPDNFDEYDKRKYADNGYVYKRNSYYEVGVYMSQFTSGVKVISLSYHLTNVMIQYTDCAGFYYKFVDEDNEMDYEKISATVRFAEENRNDLSLWTHLEYGNGEGVFPDGETVSQVNYTVTDLTAGEFFETRLLLPSENYSPENHVSATRQNIFDEEENWRASFERKVKLLKAVNVIDYIGIVIVAVATVLLIILFRKKREPHKDDTVPPYVREIPDGWSAGEMAPLYHYYKKYDVSDGISATILELFRKKVIAIKTGEKKKEATISIVNQNPVGLLPHEFTVYAMLKRVSGGQPFTMKQFEKTAQRNPEAFAKYIEEFKKLTLNKLKAKRYLPSTSDDKYGNTMSAIGSVFVVFGVLICFLSLVTGVFAHISFTGLAFLVGGIAFFIAKSKQKQPLTKGGQHQHDVFLALGKFMTEFSNMDRHELPAIAIWEEYMVYATAMGIADEVEKQIEIAYPEYRNFVSSGTGYSDSYARTFAILYLMSPRFRIANGFMLSSAVNGICRTVTTMQRNAKIVSGVKSVSSTIGRGGFGGGGFSGGGGGFGGGGSHAR